MTTRILQLTDLHLFADPEERLKGVPTRETFREVLGFATSRGIEFDHLILTGDLAHDEQAETYRALRGMLHRWLPRCRLIPGNHDDPKAIRAAFPEIVPPAARGGSFVKPGSQGERGESGDECGRRQQPAPPAARGGSFVKPGSQWERGESGDECGRRQQPAPPGEGPLTFSIGAGPWRLIGLDSRAPGEVSGRIGEKQLAWLDRELAAHAEQPTILFVHHPPVPVGVPWLDRIALDEPEAFCRLVRRWPQVKIVSAGHVHHEFEGRLGQARVVTTPSTGLQFRPAGYESAYEAAPPGYRMFALSDGESRTAVVRLPEVRYPPEE